MIPDLSALDELEARRDRIIAAVTGCPETTTVRLDLRIAFAGRVLPTTVDEIRCMLTAGHEGVHEGFNGGQPWTWTA